MADWILVPCLVQLRDEFNLIAPDRDKKSDGSIGDPAHEERESDHNRDESGNVPIRDPDRINEVHAIDIDVDLRVPGLSMEKVVQFLLTRCRSGAEKRLRYIIYNRRIWSASNGWRQQSYTGSNPHDKHGHFSSSYETKHEASTASWHLEELTDVAFTDEDGTALVKKVRGTREFLSDTQVMLIGQDAAARLAPVLGRIEVALSRAEAALKLELADVAPTAEQNAAAVLAALGNRVGETPETTAAKIRAALEPVLGDRAEAVFQLIGEAK